MIKIGLTILDRTPERIKMAPQPQTVRIPGKAEPDHLYRIQEKDLDAILDEFTRILNLQTGPIQYEGGAWLDLGAGDGLLEAELNKAPYSTRFLQRISRLDGIDLHQRRVDQARVNHKLLEAAKFFTLE